VGTFAVQIAKAVGAEVTGVCSTAKTEPVQGLGADHVVDYTRKDFADGEHSYDVILDIGGNSRLSHLRRALTSKGRLVIVGGETDGRWLGGFDRQLRAINDGADTGTCVVVFDTEPHAQNAIDPLTPVGGPPIITCGVHEVEVDA
jgi:NADPH:quinone reductase-like Zn-dependent oxidoreductase